MQNPVILAVDDEPAVLAAVVRDLRREYGGAYRILRAGSGDAALDALRTLKLRDEPVALLVVDQRMPGVSGVEMLREAVALHPSAKRVLLTAYADTEAAIRAINEVRLDHYLMKPWDPPEQHLYPVLNELLDDWRAEYRAPYNGVRVLGHRWSADAHRIKDFLARNLVPYRWLDVETDAEAAQLAELAEAPAAALPVVVLPDGATLKRPTNAELAARLGLRTSAAAEVYDLVIVGAGPAGLAAAVYAGSEGLRTLLIERDAPGGQAGQSSRIENYLGFPRGLGGANLTRRAVEQAEKFSAELLRPREVTGLRLKDQYRIVRLDDGAEVRGQSLLIATGVSYRMLDVPGAERLTGMGVYYGAAMSEAMETRDLDVAVVGGGNSAGQAAVHLAGFARTVTMLVRGTLAAGMSSYLIDQIAATPNVAVRENTHVTGVDGETSLERVTVRHGLEGPAETLDIAALFVFIGAVPRTDWLGDVVARDRQGYILSGRDLTADGRRPPHWPLARDPFWLETSVPGIFVAGDVRARSVKRIASAVGEGSMAVQFVHQHLGSVALAPKPAPAPDPADEGTPVPAS